MWFGLLFFAGITSSVSMLTPITAFFREEFGIKREKAAWGLGAFCFLFGLLHVHWLAHGFLDEWDYWAGTFGLVIVAVIETVLFMWVFKPEHAWRSIHQGADLKLPGILQVRHDLRDAALPDRDPGRVGVGRRDSDPAEREVGRRRLRESGGPAVRDTCRARSSCSLPSLRGADPDRVEAQQVRRLQGLRGSVHQPRSRRRSHEYRCNPADGGKLDVHPRDLRRGASRRCCGRRSISIRTASGRPSRRKGAAEK